MWWVRLDARRKVLSHSSKVQGKIRSLLWDLICSCSRAGRLKALSQPSNGHRWVLCSDGYRDEVVEKGVAGVSFMNSLVTLGVPEAAYSTSERFSS